jgi:hypothetical protein
VSSTMDELARALELKEKGALSEAEFERIKSDLLSGHSVAKPKAVTPTVLDYGVARWTVPASATGDPTRSSRSNAAEVAKQAGGCAGKVVLYIVVSIILVNLFMCVLISIITSSPR